MAEQIRSAEAKRRLAGILSADVAGYSRLMGANERATMDRLFTYRGVFHDHVSRHDGRIVDTSGDSVLAVFDSVIEAVECAVGIQSELAERNRELPEERRMRFRVGVNLGDVLEGGDGTVYGDGVNVAARLESLADPGGVCLSGGAFEQVRGKVAHEFEDIGEREAKNIARPVRVFRWIGTAAAPAPLLAPASAPVRGRAAERPTVAVLPFDNLSGDREQEYFADGMAEDLITALSRIRWLLVIARNSTFTYKGRAVDVKQVGRELGAQYVLEGSVRKVGDRVRVTAQLIESGGASHLWARRYDRDLADIFAIQDELTEAIAGAIEPELAEAERERAGRKPPADLDAWDCYQRGLWHMWQLVPQQNVEARAYFRRAAELDPGFAPAFAGLAFSHFLDVTVHLTDGAESLARARAAAVEAIAIDAKDATAHCVLGRVDTALGDHPSAMAALETSIRLNPSLALAHFGLALCLLLTGRAVDSIAEFELAERLSPHDPYMPVFQGVRSGAHVAAGQFREAEQCARRALLHPRPSFWGHASLAAALAAQGRIPEAEAALGRLLEVQPTFSPASFDEVWPNTDPTLRARYFGLLRRAGLALPDDPTESA